MCLEIDIVVVLVVIVAVAFIISSHVQSVTAVVFTVTGDIVVIISYQLEVAVGILFFEAVLFIVMTDCDWSLSCV